MSKLSNLFKMYPGELHVPRALFVLGISLIELFILYSLNLPQYYLSALFGTLFVGLSDPGGFMTDRATILIRVTLLGTLLTALGFALGTANWTLITACVFIVTLCCGLTIKFGTHSFVTVMLLNIWFIIAIAISAGYRDAGTASNSLLQAAIWFAGATFWIAIVCSVWFVTKSDFRNPPVAEMPEDSTHKVLTKPLIMFAVIRAAAIAVATAIAFGLNLPHADWMPVAAIVAMKANLQQSSLVAMQRLVGALIGALIAMSALAVIHGRPELIIISLVLMTAAVAVRFVNYTLYCAGTAAAVLIIIDIPNPSDLQAESQRVLFTLVGVGIGWVVMLLADMLSKRSSASSNKRPPASRKVSATV